MKLCLPAVSVAAVLAISGAAVAGPGPTVFSFNYQNLSGSYNMGSGAFSAVAASAPSQINSVGSVTRTAPPTSTANFGAGFVAGADPSDFQLSMAVSNIAGGGFLASGFGSFVITDKDGDTLSGNISGDRTLGLGFSQTGTAVNYFGELTNVVFTPFPASGNTTFDGSSSGSFNFATIPGGPIFNGFIVELVLSSSAAPFTSYDWGYIPGVRAPVATGVNAELVPAPGAAALLGLGGLVTARRRRR